MQPSPERSSLSESPEDTMYTWRLRSLLEALPQKPASEEEVEALRIVAISKADLHRACDALEQGCTVGLLLSIFT